MDWKTYKESIKEWDKGFLKTKDKDGNRVVRPIFHKPVPRRVYKEMIQTDCFAYIEHVNGNPSCGALSSLECQFGECKFYKTKEQDERDRERYPYNPKEVE